MSTANDWSKPMGFSVQSRSKRVPDSCRQWAPDHYLAPSVRGHSAPHPGVCLHMTRNYKVLMISGSLRGGSTNTALVRTAMTVGLPLMVLSLYEGMSELPHVNPDDDVPPRSPAVEGLRAAIRAADAVVFSTPEYAGDLPGSFKNLLDWAVGDDQTASLYEKPVAWINCSPRGATDAHASLLRVLGYLGATIVSEACVRTPLERISIGSDGLVDSDEVRRSLADALTHLGAAI